jgi:mycothiol synthase
VSVARKHPRLARSLECDRHALRQTRRHHWRGADVPEYVDLWVAQFCSLRGDETVTEQIADAITGRSDRCFVIEHHDVDADCRALAVVVEDVRFGERRWTVETVAPFNEPRTHHRLLDTVLAINGRPRHVSWRPPSAAMAMYPIPMDASVERTVLEMRGPVPPKSEIPKGVRIQSAVDCKMNAVQLGSRVVAVNNAAFGTHPDQGGLMTGDVVRRIAARWFDPSLLLFAIDGDGNDVGFVWMKCEPARPIELYVVGVLPDANIKGLGRALITHGFHQAASLSRADGAFLFVDAANSRATALYRSLGFTAVRRQDVVTVSN